MTRNVRITVRVAGELVDDVTFPVGVGNRDLIGDLADSHGEICARATLEGKPYLVDLEFWDGEHARFGTDAAGMVHPLSVVVGRWLEKLTEELER